MVLDRFYEHLLNRARGRLAKLMMCGVIGGIVGATAALKSGEAVIRSNGQWFAAGGVAAGLLAGVLLTLQDHLNDRRHVAGKPQRGSASRIFRLVMILIALSALVAVGGCLVTEISLR